MILNEDRSRLEALISQALGTLDGENKGTYVSLSALTSDQVDSLSEARILFQRGDRSVLSYNNALVVELIGNARGRREDSIIIAIALLDSLRPLA